MKKVVKRTKKKVASPAVVKTAPSLLVTLFDTETTGLTENRTVALDKQPEIIEFYACAVDLGGRSPGKIIREVDELILPKKMPLPSKITKITGITDEMLEGKCSFLQHSQDVVDFLAGEKIAIAHNASFDKDMIEIEMERVEKELGEDKAPELVWPRLLCTVEQTIHIRGYRLSLSNLYSVLFSEQFQGAHRAKVDVEALTRCAVELHRREVF